MKKLRRIYLDWNATTPPLAQVLDAMREAGLASWGNPSSVHERGRAARRVIEEAREILAEQLRVAARDVVFTSGATEANNLALGSAPGIVTSRLEHPSVTALADRLERAGGWVRWLSVLPSGLVDLGSLAGSLVTAPPGTIVALSGANHETGVIQPVNDAARIAHECGGRLHVDAAQSFMKLPATHLDGADSVAVSAHKLRGPKGVGALGWRPGSAPTPLLVGGGQQRGLRAGTEDPIAVAGFLAALGEATATSWRELGRLRDELDRRLASFASINGTAARLPHVTNLSFGNWEGDALVAALDLAGVEVSSGAACSAGTQERSPVITAMLGADRAACAVRFSVGPATQADDIAVALERIQRVLGAPTGDP